MGWLKNAWYWPRKHKEFASTLWPEIAGREYDKGHVLTKLPGAGNKLLGALHKSNAAGYYAAGAAAELASESLGGWLLDLGSLGKGKFLSRGVAGAAKLLSRGVSAEGTTAKTLARVAKLAQKWSEPGSGLFLGRKAVKLGTMSERTIGSTGTGAATPPSPFGGSGGAPVGVRTPSTQPPPSLKSAGRGPFTFTRRTSSGAIARPGSVVFTGGTEITARSKPYVPGAESRTYRALSSSARADVNARANELFRQQTGVTRKLTNGPEDLAYRRQWLRARDQVIATSSGPFTFTRRTSSGAIARPGSVVFTGGTEITARSKPYVPGAESRTYRALSSSTRADVNARANELFRQQTGVTRKLTNGPEDLAYRRQWLRARDQVMANWGR